jgi:hypothetical protein
MTSGDSIAVQQLSFSLTATHKSGFCATVFHTNMLRPEEGSQILWGSVLMDGVAEVCINKRNSWNRLGLRVQISGLLTRECGSPGYRI